MVLAVTVLVSQDFICGVRFKPARANINADIADVSANPVVKLLGLIPWRRCPIGKFVSQCLNLWCDFGFGLHQVLEGSGEFGIARICAELNTRRKINELYPVRFWWIGFVLTEPVFITNSAVREGGFLA